MGKSGCSRKKENQLYIILTIEVVGFERLIFKTVVIWTTGKGNSLADEKNGALI